GCIMYFRAREKVAATAEADQPLKLAKRLKTISLVIAIFGIWLLIGSIITLIFGSASQEEFTVSVMPPRAGFSILGYEPSVTMLVGWGVMAVLIIIAVILRIFFIPRLSDDPGKFQNAIETIVEAVESYASERTIDLGRPMYGYIFAIGITLIANAVAELMGFRSPSSDLMFTAALSLLAFLMANWYGIRKLSLKGRLKGLMSPSPLLLPIRIITDLANPLSMACRLFGNTISGMIIMELIYMVLGNFDAFIPSIVGLYFNVFTALIQTIIFITLTLSNINEATTEPES
ncbi:MAG: FoF1 ATP synthase subunit A, partial [Sporomusa sp.]